MFLLPVGVELLVEVLCYDLPLVAAPVFIEIAVKSLGVDLSAPHGPFTLAAKPRVARRRAPVFHVEALPAEVERARGSSRKASLAWRKVVRFATLRGMGRRRPSTNNNGARFGHDALERQNIITAFTIRRLALKNLGPIFRDFQLIESTKS